MGGYGSGRKSTGKAAPTVESALRLPIGNFAEALNTVAGGALLWPGSLRWSRMGRETAAIGFMALMDGDRPAVRLSYTTTPVGGQPAKRDYLLQVEATQPNYGGRRWWWLCPRCQKRVGVLWLCSEARRFECRGCCGLTYESSQESHKYDGLFRRMGFDPAAAQRALKQRQREMARQQSRAARRARRGA